MERMEVSLDDMNKRLAAAGVCFPDDILSMIAISVLEALAFMHDRCEPTEIPRSPDCHFRTLPLRCP